MKPVKMFRYIYYQSIVLTMVLISLLSHSNSAGGGASEKWYIDNKLPSAKVNLQNTNSIYGTAMLQGRTIHSGIKILLSEAECSIPLTSISFTATTDSAGYFEIPIAPEQSYRCLQLNYPGYLSAQQSSPLPGNLGAINLIAGDVNSDNKINFSDLALIGPKYGSTDPMVDLNSNGIVDMIDLTLVSNNYNQNGPILIASTNQQIPEPPVTPTDTPTPTLLPDPPPTITPHDPTIHYDPPSIGEALPANATAMPSDEIR